MAGTDKPLSTKGREAEVTYSQASGRPQKRIRTTRETPEAAVGSKS